MNAVAKTDNQLAEVAEHKSIKAYVSDARIKQKFEEVLGKKTQGFLASVMQVADQAHLKKAVPATVVNAAMMAATLDLPINNNLGFAYIVPYTKKVKNTDKKGAVTWTESTEAQFQLGYKGFIQLAQRSGQFKRINACAIYSEDTDESILNRLKSMIPKSPVGTVVGYIGYFELLNGYEGHLSMTIDELKAHAMKFSQTYKSAETATETWKKGKSVWHEQFEAMATKTVLKLLLSKQAPLSIEMQRAVVADQAVIKDVSADGADDIQYPDNQIIDHEPTLIDLTQDQAKFDQLSTAIANGDMDKMEVLSGERYIINDEQRNLIAGL